MNAPPRPRRFSWIASPMLAWGLHFATVYSLQGLGCARGWGDAATRLAMGAATVLALVAVGWIGLRAWRRLRTVAGTRDGTFAARLVAILSLLAAVAIGFTALPMFLLLPCE
ncbi:hypothetical protein FZO89_16975 [Luteimonas viscosa]|uniref:Uncharacterized protein n=1 Tax=Luteimonas viscosa TaxID=1132694 RepID=A0A5D4XGZ2_9GAMM|nr:hypothetical protein [Luteimonas viscosa]TYT23907.1 hypothetical protein FZO89_16975 [Luteimonas viscosa]